MCRPGNLWSLCLERASGPWDFNSSEWSRLLFHLRSFSPIHLPWGLGWAPLPTLVDLLPFPESSFLSNVAQLLKLSSSLPASGCEGCWRGKAGVECSSDLLVQGAIKGLPSSATWWALCSSYTTSTPWNPTEKLTASKRLRRWFPWSLREAAETMGSGWEILDLLSLSLGMPCPSQPVV